MDGIKVLFLSEKAEIRGYSEIAATLRASVSKAESVKKLPPANILVEYNVLFIDIDNVPEDPCGLCGEIREIMRGRPYQLVLLSERDKKNYQKIVICGGDDFITVPVERDELIARLGAAEIRLKQQQTLLEEQEYLKNAAKVQEERFRDASKRNEELQKDFQRMLEVNKELEHIARYDYLSGLLNRMNLYSLMEKEIERSQRHDVPLSGIMVDIDHFKPINDNYGHQAGDQVIRELGKKLLSTLRKYDHAGRYGGEEFFVILPNTDVEGAKNIAERFRAALDEDVMEIGGENIKVTASMGIAQLRKGESRESWIARADKAMYMAKELGRNRVAAEPEPVGE